MHVHGRGGYMCTQVLCGGVCVNSGERIQCCVGACAWVCEEYGCSGLCSCAYVSCEVNMEGCVCM